MRPLTRIALILSVSLLMQGCVGCANVTTETASMDSAAIDTVEEVVQNPLFNTKSQIAIVGPSHGSVWSLAAIDLNLERCGLYQNFAIGRSRFFASGGAITNWSEAAIGFLQVTNGFSYANHHLSPADFFEVIGGETQAANLTVAAGGYYLVSWSHERDGNLSCSSPQIQFFVR